ncbi:DUF2059 domain-containing protein [Brevundimonas sp.]|uniref:DUF2059 domain-containing protein n=1 Tax=Brevundimonas sp. TaxID=1871086 RepID=UPI0027300208|nr:DUF2059 domain-containing protein [Brevundimonas sp.]MDP1912496.1 DUF2059 domain-containing protein [Brevundimonas sp.]
MRFMIVCLAAIFAVVAFPAAPSAAQQVEQAATSPSPRRMALTRQYLDLLMTDQFEGVLHQMLGAEFENDSEIQAMPDEDRRMLLSLTAELTADMVPQMITEMVPVYAATFTEEELTALVAFYDTPLGRSIADKSIEVMPEADRAVMSVVPQLLEKMATRMCQHYGCSPEEQREMLEGMREGAGLAPSSAVRSK